MNKEKMQNFNDFIEMIKFSIKNNDCKTAVYYKNLNFNDLEYQLQFFNNENGGINFRLSNINKDTIYKNIDKMQFDCYPIHGIISLFQDDIKEYRKIKLFNTLNKDLKVNNKKEKLIKI